MQGNKHLCQLETVRCLEFSHWKARKSCPLFPTYPEGNCLISNFGKAPGGRELCSHSSITCSQHVHLPAVVLFHSCQDKLALLPQHVASAHRNVHVCVLERAKARVAAEATPKVRLRGNIWKTGSSFLATRRRIQTKQQLGFEFKCGKSVCAEPNLKVLTWTDVCSCLF